MGLKMVYDSEYIKSADVHVEIKLREDCNLQQMFLNFVDMTRVMGFHSGSWEQVLEDAYKACVLKEDAPSHYTVYDYMNDCRDDDEFFKYEKLIS